MEDEVGGECDTHGKVRPFVKHERKWKDNIKMNLKQVLMTETGFT
jgi:hypothetical protein